MIIFKQRRGFVLLVITAFAYWNAASWMEKPYTNIEHQDRNTIRGKKPIWNYVMSKLYSQHRTLEGLQDYAMYIYIHAPSGIRYAYVTIDGAQLNLNVPPGTGYFTYELEGVKTLGRHKYQLDVMDGKGKKGHSQCYLTVEAGDGVP